MNQSPRSAPALRGRASWSGLLQISLVALPVKAYAAIDSTEPIRFNQLHAGCGQRIAQPRHCPVHGAVAAGEVDRAYQYAPGQYVVVRETELDALRPANEKALCIEQFIAPQEVDPVYLSGRSSYLLPDGRAAWQPYMLVADAIQRHRRWGLGRVVLSGRRRAVLLRTSGGILTMHVLHDPPQVRRSERWNDQVPELELDPAQQALAERLVCASDDPVDWSRYCDDLQQQLVRLVERKISGREAIVEPAGTQPEAIGLLDALRQSVARAEAGTGAVKSTSGKRLAKSRCKSPARSRRTA